MTSYEFRAARETLGLTQKQLAAAMGMEQPSISRIEGGGRYPTRQQACHIKSLLFIKQRRLLADYTHK